MPKAKAKKTSKEVWEELDSKWSGWRGFQRRNPLTASWISFAVGAVVGATAIFVSEAILLVEAISIWIM